MSTKLNVLLLMAFSLLSASQASATTHRAGKLLYSEYGGFGSLQDVRMQCLEKSVFPTTIETLYEGQDGATELVKASFALQASFDRAGVTIQGGLDDGCRYLVSYRVGFSGGHHYRVEEVFAPEGKFCQKTRGDELALYVNSQSPMGFRFEVFEIVSTCSNLVHEPAAVTDKMKEYYARPLGQAGENSEKGKLSRLFEDILQKK